MKFVLIRVYSRFNKTNSFLRFCVSAVKIFVNQVYHWKKVYSCTNPFNSGMNANMIREVLTELGIRPTKNLGQNFLTDPSIIQSQVEFANLTNRDTVLEIGAGLGNLTLELSAHARKVITIEKDKKLGGYLKTIVPDNVELIIGDALDLDFPRFDKIVANLPYKISSPLSFKLMDYEFESAILMYQREFADRIVASPGSKKYGRLTVNLYYRFESRLLRDRQAALGARFGDREVGASCHSI